MNGGDGTLLGQAALRFGMACWKPSDSALGRRTVRQGEKSDTTGSKSLMGCRVVITSGHTGTE